MKKNICNTVLALVIFLFDTQMAQAQWDNAEINISFSIPQITLVDIEPSLNNNIHFTITPATEVGNTAVIQQSSNVGLWLNYSSCMSAFQSSRSILAEISQGSFPEGIKLYVEASNYSGTGKGRTGQSTGRINITSQPKPIINNLGNCFTGDGIKNGHSLNFSLEINDFSKIHSAENTNFTILYTITDN